MTTAVQAPLPGADHFGSQSLHSSSYSRLPNLNTSIPYPDSINEKSSYIHAEYEPTYPASAPSSAPSSPQLTHATFSRPPSYNSTPASSVSLDIRTNAEDDDQDDMAFPAFEGSSCQQKSPYVPQNDAIEEESSHPLSPNTEEHPDLPEKVQDDQAVEDEPTRHVDYLSHNWKEEDIWSSWRYVVQRRKKISNSIRLENASWRTWMKAKNQLKTVSPETLNWLKDCDVTWLYGPLQTERKPMNATISPPPSRLSHSSSFIAKKPILKKKSASAAILERSRSQNSLLQRASEIIRVQQSSPAHGRQPFRRGHSELSFRYTGSSVANTPAEHDVPAFTGTRSSFAFNDPPTPSDCKHVLFNEEVRQVQAVDSEDDEKEEIDEAVFDTDEDDDGGLMMAPTRSRGSNKSTPRGSFTNDSKTIMPLPSTTLKYRTDTPEPPPQPPQQHGLWPRGRTLSPSPSSETLRPSQPNRNFLIDDDPEVSDEPWQPRVIDSVGESSYDDDSDPGPSMRRTPSGMFMPYDENEEEAVMNSTLFGQAVYAVNTFKDIAHVVWNVGWTRK